MELSRAAVGNVDCVNLETKCFVYGPVAPGDPQNVNKMDISSEEFSKNVSVLSKLFILVQVSQGRLLLQIRIGCTVDK